MAKYSGSLTCKASGSALDSSVSFSLGFWAPPTPRVLGWPFSTGPLHTRAKSRIHEIVRAQKKVPKGRPNTPLKSCTVVTDPPV